MLTVGVIVGFRPQGNPLNWAAAFALVLYCGFAFSWIGAMIGLIAPNPEGVQAFGFIMIFPLTFASSAFVPTSTMPGWLRAFTSYQPVSVIVDAARALLLGQAARNSAWQAFVWCTLILIIFAPISVSLYRRKTAR
jgi:ABC-type multidrug transport system permease subunit